MIAEIQGQEKEIRLILWLSPSHNQCLLSGIKINHQSISTNQITPYQEKEDSGRSSNTDCITIHLSLSTHSQQLRTSIIIVFLLLLWKKIMKIFQISKEHFFFLRTTKMRKKLSMKKNGFLTNLAKSRTPSNSLTYPT